MKINYRHFVGCSVPIVLSAIGTVPTTFAQSTFDAGFMLEEIVVTARRVEENLQDTPNSITALTGAELELTWVPNSAWLIEAGISSVDTSVDTLLTIAGTGIGVAVGNALPFSPELQANFGLSNVGTLNNGASLTPRLDVFYQDRTFFDANNTAEIAQIDSVSVVNLTLGYEPASAAWGLTFGVTNATDEVYPTGGNSSLTTGSGYAEIVYARPREYFVSSRNSF